MSYFRPSGTAREQAIGGTMGSLGGDITANFVNPAGLGFYKTGEALFSPGYGFNTSKTNYLSNKTNSPSVNNFIIGTSGFVYGWSSPEPGSSTAISLAVTRSADFNAHVSYQGSNPISSGAEAYAEEFNNSGLTLDQAIAEPGISYGTRMALWTYLVDTANGGSSTVVQPLNVLATDGQLGQQMDIRTSGGITEIALGLAGVTKDKWYIGASIGVPIVSYQQTLQYTETDLSGNTNNDFASYTYSEYYTSSGVGVNGRVGVIFRPNLNWRIGLAVHTPSFYSLTDKVSSSMVTNTEGYAGIRTVQSSELPQGDLGNSLTYDLQTPWHLLVSGSYIFPGAVTHGSMGFVTADIEYIAVKSTRFSLPTDANGNTVNSGYYDPLNNTIKDYYKNTFNFRMGGEYKMNDKLAIRLGGSYTMNPYSSPELKANRTTLSGGVGYRIKGVFVDLTYIEAISNDVNIPYRLALKDNVFSTVKQYTGNILLTLGIKF